VAMSLWCRWWRGGDEGAVVTGVATEQLSWWLPWWWEAAGCGGACRQWVVDRIDRATGRHFGVRRKTFLAAAIGGGRLMMAGGGGGRPTAGEEGENQEFWATATVHHHAIRFKMDNKKHIVNLESFRDMLHICPRVPGQSFAEPPFKEEILAFIRFLGHSVEIRTLTDVEHKDHKKSNEMYYPRFTKVIIHHFMSKDPSIPRRNKFGALLRIELTNEEIRNSNAYKEYYTVATRAAPPKPKASVRKTRSSSDTTITPPTVAAGPRLTTSQKGKQAAKASKAKSLSALSE
nr:hypothetical protein [Tanacetum cinerariifolium]